MADRARIQDLYSAFSQAGPAVTGVPHAISFTSEVPGPHVVFGIMVHGNETGALPAAAALAQALSRGDQAFTGTVSLFIGNPEAGLAGERFLQADLNRVFIDSDLDTVEHRRARQLRRILDTADLFVDFHQTIEPTSSPFYIFPWSSEGEAWVRALAVAPRWVTRAPGKSFSTGTCCADEYVRNRNRPALTVELSQKGFRHEAASLAMRTMQRTLAQASGPLPRQGPLPECLETTFSQRFTDPEMTLRKGLSNFQTVSAGETLSAPGTPRLVCPINGLLMFPKYPRRDTNRRALAPRPGEIYRVLQPITGLPADHYQSGAP